MKDHEVHLLKYNCTRVKNCETYELSLLFRKFVGLGLPCDVFLVTEGRTGLCLISFHFDLDNSWVTHSLGQGIVFIHDPV